MELHRTTEKHIDIEQGVITVEGPKQHNGRAYKFKASTVELLCTYMATHHRLHPFPSPQAMGDNWRLARKKAAIKLSRTDLNKIPLKGAHAGVKVSSVLLLSVYLNYWEKFFST